MRFFKNIAFVLLLTSCAAEASNHADENYTGSTKAFIQKPPVVEAGVDETEFNNWLSGFKTKALQNGISQSTVTSALDGLKPVKKVIKLDKKQPETQQTREEYLAKVINNARIQKGRQMMAENKALLADISKQTGVEPEFIVALWGLETGYGENIGNYNVIASLATLAYEGRRREFFEGELMSALLIVDEHHATAAEMRGSWAGAMGQCQFMPSSYLAYAVDYNRDGRIDIWSSKEDVLASIANYLSTIGWGKDKAQKEKALMNWNKSSYFVASVFKLAELIK